MLLTLMYMYHYFCFSHFSGEPELAGLPWFFSSIFFRRQSLGMCSTAFLQARCPSFHLVIVSSHWREQKIPSQWPGFILSLSTSTVLMEGVLLPLQQFCDSSTLKTQYLVPPVLAHSTCFVVLCVCRPVSWKCCFLTHHWNHVERQMCLVLYVFQSLETTN